MELTNIQKCLEEFLSKKDLKLFEVSYFKKDSILQVMLDESLDLDNIEIISNEISSYLDTIDIDLDSYLLDVTTVGSERPIRNESELKDSVGSYIYIKTKEEELNGTLEKFEEGILTISYKEKTKNKIKTISYTDIKKIRHAIKF